MGGWKNIKDYRYLRVNTTYPRDTLETHHLFIKPKIGKTKNNLYFYAII